MQPSIIYRYAILSIAIFTSSGAIAQELTKEEKNAAIQTIARHIAENYVSQEKGGQIASHIQMANFRGEFDKASSWNVFDSMVTRSLQRYSQDPHLYIKNDPAMVREIQAHPFTGIRAQVGDHNPVADGNYGFRESKIMAGNIGYLSISEIQLSEKSLPILYEHMHKLQNTAALIIDLRDNSGGFTELGPVLESYFLAAGTPLLDHTTRSEVTSDSAVTWLKEKRYTQPVYIIINKNTCSAAEAFAYTLQHNKRAQIVGETSAGAANTNKWFAVDNNNYLSVSTSVLSLPGKQITWEHEGVRPDIRIKKEDPVAVIMSRHLKKGV